MYHGSRLVRFAVLLALLHTFLATTPASAQDEEFRLPPRSDNAAINYLLAAALLKQPATPADMKAQEVIEEKIWKLPPKALSECPEVVTLLDADLSRAGAVNVVHQGAGKPRCAFDVDWEAGPSANLQHLSLMRKLARRCIAAAKCAEFKGESLRAAEICGDVMRMAAHLAEEPLIISGLVGAAVLDVAASEAEGLLARDPGVEAAEKLLSILQGVPARPFPLDIYFRSEAEIFGGWYERNLKTAAEDIAGMADGPDAAPMIERISAGKPEDLLNWIRGYREFMDQLAEAARGPYWESASRAAELMAKVGGDAAKDNPLLTTLVPSLSKCQEQFATAEARLGMMKLLCAAQLHKEKTGHYLAALDELSRYFPDDRLPKDPFTGKAFVYTLVEGLPRIECQPPEELKQQRPGRFHFDLARRRAEDAPALEQFLREQKAEE